MHQPQERAWPTRPHYSQCKVGSRNSLCALLARTVGSLCLLLGNWCGRPTARLKVMHLVLGHGAGSGLLLSTRCTHTHTHAHAHNQSSTPIPCSLAPFCPPRSTSTIRARAHTRWAASGSRQCFLVPDAGDTTAFASSSLYQACRHVDEDGWRAILPPFCAFVGDQAYWTLEWLLVPLSDESPLLTPRMIHANFKIR